MGIVSVRDDFSLSGPLHLTAVDWTNEDHARSVKACLVKGVYIIERDRQNRREGSQALAPPWWEFFNFRIFLLLEDKSDGSIFGVIYELKKPSPAGSPSYVIAFRGTLIRPDSVKRDLKLNISIIRNDLHLASRFEVAIQAVKDMVGSVGSSNICLVGHSLGSALALLVGKTMAKTGVFLESCLFNPPIVSAPIERIENEKVKDVLRIAKSVIKAGLARTMKKKKKTSRHDCSADEFLSLSAWIPCLYVNPGDHICSEYVGYFDHRKKMEEIGFGRIERLATQHSLGVLLMNAFSGKALEPIHVIPSANLTINLTPCHDFKEARGIQQWWQSDLQLESKLYTFS